MVYCVINYVMKPKGKYKIDFGNKPKRYNNFYLIDEETSIEKFRNQQFVVPWQMVELKKSKNLVE